MRCIPEVEAQRRFDPSMGAAGLKRFPLAAAPFFIPNFSLSLQGEGRGEGSHNRSFMR
jgi:hypothetical protein